MHNTFHKEFVSEERLSYSIYHINEIIIRNSTDIFTFIFMKQIAKKSGITQLNTIYLYQIAF